MKDQKYIKVLSRGYVTTNRGRAFTPITRAFKESTQNIFTMITKEKATVVEVLSNGKEIQLTPQNFDKDNEVLEVKKTIAVTVAAPVAEVAPVEPIPPLIHGYRLERQPMRSGYVLMTIPLRMRRQSRRQKRLQTSSLQIPSRVSSITEKEIRRTATAMVTVLRR